MSKILDVFEKRVDLLIDVLSSSVDFSFDSREFLGGSFSLQQGDLLYPRSSCFALGGLPKMIYSCSSIREVLDADGLYVGTSDFSDSGELIVCEDTLPIIKTTLHEGVGLSLEEAKEVADSYIGGRFIWDYLMITILKPQARSQRIDQLNSVISGAGLSLSIQPEHQRALNRKMIGGWTPHKLEDLYLKEAHSNFTEDPGVGTVFVNLPDDTSVQLPVMINNDAIWWYLNAGSVYMFLLGLEHGVIGMDPSVTPIHLKQHIAMSALWESSADLDVCTMDRSLWHPDRVLNLDRNPTKFVEDVLKSEYPNRNDPISMANALSAWKRYIKDRYAQSLQTDRFIQTYAIAPPPEDQQVTKH